MKHKWCEVIVALAEGKVVQRRDPLLKTDWCDYAATYFPDFENVCWQWRVKPKPDIVEYARDYGYCAGHWSASLDLRSDYDMQPYTLGLRWSGVVWEFFVESWGGWCVLKIYASTNWRAMTFDEGLRHAHWRCKQGLTGSMPPKEAQPATCRNYQVGERMKAANAKLTDGADWPATRTVHCPNRPVNACDRHVEQITGMMAFLGTHVIHTAAPDGAQCGNCVNEHKGPNELLDSIIMMANDLRVLFICLQSTDPQSSNIEESLEFSSGIVVSMKRYRDERRIR